MKTQKDASIWQNNFCTHYTSCKSYAIITIQWTTTEHSVAGVLLNVNQNLFSRKQLGRSTIKALLFYCSFLFITNHIHPLPLYFW